MKITILFPRLKTFSGAENLVLAFSRHAVVEGHEVFLLTRGLAERCRERLDGSGVEVRIPRWLSGLTGSHLVDSFLDVACSPALLPYVPPNTDVLVFFCDPVLPAQWIYKRILRGRIPTGFYCLQPPRFAYDLMAETIAAHRPLGYLIPLVAAPYRVMDRLAVRACDRFYAICKDYARWCEELYGIADVRVLYPGADLSIAAGTRPEWVRGRHGIRPGEKLVVTVNKLIARKNVDVFLRAMRVVAERVPEAKGIVVGDGPLESRLRSLCDELGLAERVVFAGFVPDLSDVAHYYAASDVYVFLEKNVPFGLTVLEAGACRRPVLAVRGGGTLETVVEDEGKRTGFLVADPLDPDEVAERICWLLEHDAERAAMGERAARHAARFALDVRAQEFVDALTELAATGSSPPKGGGGDEVHGRRAVDPTARV